ncbi:PREDICTED: uncharacterized protein LOC109466761 [Branchiostoma belcheri]|uniref:Uncharacterized protein LOC109466761 n=1 Tax=Branchiostoma belcheri TaxID=7741 RepID=A0A6P4YDB4_BRABE|nr:PREDICTED: uncharacterized protein LOC109466761 [Branchiostoma belcheri]
MLGERYGWIPSMQDVSSEIRDKYSWVDRLSITHMEIVRGAVRYNNPNAAFFLRDPDFLKDVPQGQLGNFVDTAELNTQQQKVDLSGLGRFCKLAVKFLKTAIGRRYPESRGNLSVRDQAALPHTDFMEEKGRFLTGRDAEMQRVVNFALSHWSREPYKDICRINDLSDDNPSVEEPAVLIGDDPGAEEPAVMISSRLEPEPVSRDRALMVVLGESGTGKSLFMARCAMEIRKILDDEQLELLTSSAGAGNPVWLALACEELRVFGDFNRLTEKIKALPDSMEGLMHTCITRVVKEDDTGCVEKMLCLIECSQLGLQESELQMLLGNPETATPLPALTWGHVLRSLRRFLRNTAGYQNLPVLGFFHHSISKVVQESLIKTPAVRQNYHLALADYYQSQCAVQQLVARKLPYQLHRTGMNGKLVAFLQKDPRSLYMTAADRQTYMNGVRCSNRIPAEKVDLRTAVVLCRMCATKNKVFTPSKEPNRDVCVICGLRTTTKSLSQQVHFCALHDPPDTAGKDWCISCEKSGWRIMRSSRAHLCVQCSSNSLENTCAKLLV